MYFYIKFLSSDSIYYVSVSKHDFEDLLKDLGIEFSISYHDEAAWNFNIRRYFYLDKKNKKHEIGYAASYKNDRCYIGYPSI